MNQVHDNVTLHELLMKHALATTEHTEKHPKLEPEGTTSVHDNEHHAHGGK